MRHNGFLTVLAGMALAVVLLAACTPDDVVKDSGPLPTRGVGDVCGFVSKESASIALGTTKFSVGGAVQALPGAVKNPDGSKLNLAGCEFQRADGALNISVTLIGIPPYEEREIPNRLKAGDVDFVFPVAEGQGVAEAGGPGGQAAVAQLIRGDWYYLVILSKPTEGRNAVDDVVAILRQVVDELGLPRSENLPRPVATPTR
jgi:ABC-type amino acid transport substrate-binding protein